KNAATYTYDNADELTSDGTNAYTYDANGNQITRGADTFTSDHENRLTQSVVGGVTSSSVYYGNGVRRSHTVNGVTTTYVYDVASKLPLVLQDGTSTLVYGLDLISSTDGGGNQTYFSTDGLGSTTDLTNGAGAVTDTYSYDVFGAVLARTGTNASPWKFTGEQEDGASGDSGYYFLRARYLDLGTGRFISKDPIEFDQRYGYASGNPVLWTDRNGMCGEACGSYGPAPIGNPMIGAGVLFNLGPSSVYAFGYRGLGLGGDGVVWGGPGSYPGHNGQDIGAPLGTNVTAIRSGIVKEVVIGSVYEGGEGETSTRVVIEHPGGWRTAYVHMDGVPVNLRAGQYVSQGESLGGASCIGHCRGNHLHLELQDPSGQYQSPLAWPMVSSPGILHVPTWPDGRSR
ncbi:MAG: peptidoglycan DD-metalloendopeptidase family protein, partial [Gemmatimonadaceae bacterium]